MSIYTHKTGPQSTHKHTRQVSISRSLLRECPLVKCALLCSKQLTQFVTDLCWTAALLGLNLNGEEFNEMENDSKVWKIYSMLIRDKAGCRPASRMNFKRFKWVWHRGDGQSNSHNNSLVSSNITYTNNKNSNKWSVGDRNVPCTET